MQFETQFGGARVKNAIPYAMNSGFSQVLDSEMKRFNLENLKAASSNQEEDPDKIERLQDEVSQVTLDNKLARKLSLYLFLLLDLFFLCVCHTDFRLKL